MRNSLRKLSEKTFLIDSDPLHLFKGLIVSWGPIIACTQVGTFGELGPCMCYVIE